MTSHFGRANSSDQKVQFRVSKSPLVLKGAADRPLQAGPCRFLGKISYRLYLFHLPVLFGIGRLALALGIDGPGLGPPMFVMFGSLICGIPVAWAGYVFVERPAMALGRRLAAKIQGLPPPVTSR